jgi:ketosteroid isomerase-like protein
MRGRVTAACIVCAAISAVAAGQQTTSPSTEGAKTAIAAGNQAFGTAVEKGDAAAIAALYSTNAEAFPPNSDVVRGPAAIQKMWQGVLDSGVAGADLNTTEARAEGNLAYEVGTYAMKAKDGKVLDKGKYVVVWTKDGGAWKIHRDIWNTSMPAAK